MKLRMRVARLLSPSSAGGIMPTMRMYPPSGMALMPYSVSPFVRENTVGPNPTMNCGTRMPNFRAHMKWPYSWKPMENSRPSAKATIPRTVSRADRSASGESCAGVLPGPLLRGQHVVHARGCAELRRGVEGTREDLHDGGER